ncbi:tail fiber domain-containing protein, partial [bacterium]|nr:tail fiber domain-containing protein [bacterium]
AGGTDKIIFKTGSSERMRIAGSSTGIGTNSPGYPLDVSDASSNSSTNAGINIRHALNARLRFVTTTQNVRYYVGLGDVSAALEFRDDNGNLRLWLAQNGTLRPGTDDAQDLGDSSYRYDDIFATNATIQTSDERLKTNIENCSLGLDFIKALRAVSYKWANREAETAVRMVQKTQMVTKEFEQVEVVEVEGKFVTSKSIITKEVEELVFDEHPLFDENGDPVYEMVPTMQTVQQPVVVFETEEEDGQPVVKRKVVLKEVETQVFEEFPVFDDNGTPILNDEGEQLIHRIPVMESVQVFHKVPVMEEQEYETKTAKTFNRRHFGLIAQDVLQVLQDFNIETSDFAPLTYDEEADRYGMRYAELVGILIKAIQELSTRVEALET